MKSLSKYYKILLLVASVLFTAIGASLFSGGNIATAEILLIIGLFCGLLFMSIFIIKHLHEAAQYKAFRIYLFIYLWGMVLQLVKFNLLEQGIEPWAILIFYVNLGLAFFILGYTIYWLFIRNGWSVMVNILASDD